MKITYGLLILEQIIIKGEAHYAHLKQSIVCDHTAVDANHEEFLLGFVGSSCTRDVYYRIPARTSKEDFELLLQSYPNARIVRILDHEVILSNRQRERIEKDVTTLAEIARTQLIVNNDGKVYIDLFGMPVFAQNRFSLIGDTLDQDNRWTQTTSGAELDDYVPVKQSINSQLTTKRRLTL